MTTDTKKLAEFAVEFIDPDEEWRVAEQVENEDFSPEHRYFISRYSAPVYAHLAKREMEKRGYVWKSDGGGGNYDFEIMDTKQAIFTWIGKGDENEFIAFWTAIQKAVGEE